MFHSWPRRWFRSWTAFCLLLLLTSCATYQNKVSGARELMRSGNPEAAAKILEPLAEKESDDQLVYLLDYAVALQQAARYDDSIKALLKADKIAEIQDYHSLSRITESMLLNEAMVQYKGDDYEKLLINVYLALDYLMKDNLDDALVETRRLNEKLTKYRLDAKKDYEQNAFARYLAAMIWESDKKWDDAYIDYKTVYDLHPAGAMIQQDLLRTSLLSHRSDDLAHWKKTFAGVKLNSWWSNKTFGELVLIYQQGKAPVKMPDPQEHRFPKLYPLPTFTRFAQLEVEGAGSQNTEEIYSIQDVAIKTLNDAYGPLIAKRLAAIATKYVVAKELEKKDKLLGALAWIGLNAADQADVRQWSTLPETFQVARMPLAGGKYKIKVNGLDASQHPSGENMNEREVEIKPGQRTFVMWRSFR